MNIYKEKKKANSSLLVFTLFYCFGLCCHAIFDRKGGDSCGRKTQNTGIDEWTSLWNQEPAYSHEKIFSP